MKLFRVTLKNKWGNTKGTVYAIAKDREDAIRYVDSCKKEGMEIVKVYYLGYELSGRMFASGKEPL